MGGGFPLRLKRRTGRVPMESHSLASAGRGDSGAVAHGLGWALDLAGPRFGVTTGGFGSRGCCLASAGPRSGAKERALGVIGRGFGANGRVFEVAERLFEVTERPVEVAGRVFEVTGRRSGSPVSVPDAAARVSCSTLRLREGSGRKERCQGAASRSPWNRIRFHCTRPRPHGEPTCPLPRTRACHRKSSRASPAHHRPAR